MRTLARIATTRLFDQDILYRFSQLMCYAVGPLVLVLAIRGLERAGATHAEFLIGILAALGVVMGFVATGMLVGVYAELRRH